MSVNFLSLEQKMYFDQHWNDAVGYLPEDTHLRPHYVSEESENFRLFLKELTSDKAAFTRPWDKPCKLKIQSEPKLHIEDSALYILLNTPLVASAWSLKKV